MCKLIRVTVLQNVVMNTGGEGYGVLGVPACGFYLFVSP